jgi:hypothetical protein
VSLSPLDHLCRSIVVADVEIGAAVDLETETESAAAAAASVFAAALGFHLKLVALSVDH